MLQGYVGGFLRKQKHGHLLGMVNQVTPSIIPLEIALEGSNTHTNCAGNLKGDSDPLKVYEPQKRTSYFPVYWLVDRNPYVMAYYNPYI